MFVRAKFPRGLSSSRPQHWVRQALARRALRDISSVLKCSGRQECACDVTHLACPYFWAHHVSGHAGDVLRYVRDANSAQAMRTRGAQLRV